MPPNQKRQKPEKSPRRGNEREGEEDGCGWGEEEVLGGGASGALSEFAEVDNNGG